MASRPEFSIPRFVAARHRFDQGNGSAEACVRINEISWWRLDELAQRAGSRAWSVLVGSPETGPGHQEARQRLQHALRSAQIAGSLLPALWRSRDGRGSISCVVVAHDVEEQRALRLARRYGQVAIVHVQRIPFEQVTVLEAAGGQRVGLERFEPAAIGQVLVQVVDAAALAIEYVPTGWFEGLACSIAERRLADALPHG